MLDPKIAARLKEIRKHLKESEITVDEMYQALHDCPDCLLDLSEATEKDIVNEYVFQVLIGSFDID